MPETRWRPVPQDPCPPNCTCRGPAAPEVSSPAVVQDEPGLRECGVTGCGHCRLVTDPALRQWIEDTDPAPVTEEREWRPEHGHPLPLAEFPSGTLHYGRHIA